MIPRPFRQPSGSPATCWVVRVSGELDLATSPRLARILDETPPATSALVVDLAGVDFMDCSALPVLLRAQGRYGDGLSLRGLGPPLLRLLEATGLITRFVLHDATAPCPAADSGAGAGAGADAGVDSGGSHPGGPIERCPGVRLHLGGPAQVLPLPSGPGERARDARGRPARARPALRQRVHPDLGPRADRPGLTG